MALHNFPPGDEPAYLEQDGFTPMASRLDPSKLAPRFTEQRWTCLACHDTGFIQAGPGYKPCPGCVRGDKIHGGWWKEAVERRNNRRSDPEANQLLPPADEEDIQF